MTYTLVSGLDNWTATYQPPTPRGHLIAARNEANGAEVWWLTTDWQEAVTWMDEASEAH